MWTMATLQPFGVFAFISRYVYFVQAKKKKIIDKLLTRRQNARSHCRCDGGTRVSDVRNFWSPVTYLPKDVFFFYLLTKHFVFAGKKHEQNVYVLQYVNIHQIDGQQGKKNLYLYWGAINAMTDLYSARTVFRLNLKIHFVFTDIKKNK